LGSKLVKAIVEDFASEDKAVEVTEFFKSIEFPGTERAVLLAVESIRCNDSWIKREKNHPGLLEHLSSV